MLYKFYVRLIAVILDATVVAFANVALVVISVVAEEALIDMTSNKDTIH
jgi:hypothetical protein